MSTDIVYAGDLARDLGYRGMTPEFWTWVRKVGLRSISSDKPFGFAHEDVHAALERAA